MLNSAAWGPITSSTNKIQQHNATRKKYIPIKVIYISIYLVTNNANNLIQIRMKKIQGNNNDNMKRRQFNETCGQKMHPQEILKCR
jgi:hypothetical protein